MTQFWSVKKKVARSGFAGLMILKIILKFFTLAADMKGV